MAQTGEGKLLQIVPALGLPGGLAGRLHRRQQKRDQDADDRNDHQQLDQGKTVPRRKMGLSHGQCSSTAIACQTSLPVAVQPLAHAEESTQTVQARFYRALTES
jgi:hypothetical protein